MNNQVKALVSTVALGMGYDKPDLGFVIHYQRPGSLVTYYQQIGRAGRQLENAYAILLNGKEDDEIEEYFINSAFPSTEEMDTVVKVIENSLNGIKEGEIIQQVNMSLGRLRKCLKMLTINRIITKERSIYSRTLHQWNPDIERSKIVTNQRYYELEKMKEFIDSDSCYMESIAKELDDPKATRCGKCVNCISKLYFSDKVRMDNVIDAIKFLRGEYLVIKPRKQWPAGIISIKQKRIPKELHNKEGRALCTYNDSGWGKFVKIDKYENEYFRDELVEASVELITMHWDMETIPKWVTSVPSRRRPELVKEFAKRVADTLGLPYLESIEKVQDTPQQKEMKNGYQQGTNAMTGFEVTNVINEPVILIDDMVDSRWTLTVCGAKLKEMGAGDVYPFALASSAEGGL